MEPSVRVTYFRAKVYACSLFALVLVLSVYFNYTGNTRSNSELPKPKVHSQQLGMPQLSLYSGIKQENQDDNYLFMGNMTRKLMKLQTPMTSSTIVVKDDVTVPDLTEQSCAGVVARVAYIKTHKTGSTTVGHIMNRFGYLRNQSFVLNKRRWNSHLVYKPITRESPRNDFIKPLRVKAGDYAHYKYDMITVHIRYNRAAMNSFMKPNTRYITVIRDPGMQFESAFVHFQFDDAFPLSIKHRLLSANVDDRLKEWFRHPNDYLKRLKELSWEGVKGLRYFYAKNNQIYDLGLNTEYHTDTGKVMEYISKLDKELDFVLITEYLDESLVVLRKQFCWNLEDILFISKNQRSENAKSATISEYMLQKIRAWNAIDLQLYQHFNATLWKKIRLYGEDFQRDLQQFRQRLHNLFNNCTNGQYFKKQGRYFQNVNYKPVKNGGEFCRLIAESKTSLMNRIRKRQLNDKPY